MFGKFIGATNNSIGATTVGAGNIIAFNGHNGVTIGGFSFDSSSVDDPILSNSIFGNSALGIDLGDDGVTPNHTPPAQFAPNNFQNFPDFVIAANFGSVAGVKGSSERGGRARPTRSSSSRAWSPTRPATDKGSSRWAPPPMTTDSSGNVGFSSYFPFLPPGVRYITATATDPDGNTSEFAQDAVLTPSANPIAGA